MQLKFADNDEYADNNADTMKILYSDETLFSESLNYSM